MVKRVVGMPGDTIEMHHAVLSVNGVPVPSSAIATIREPDTTQT